MAFSLNTAHETKTLTRLVRNGRSTQIILPKPWLKSLGWTAASPIVIVLDRAGALLLRKPREGELEAVAAAPTPGSLFEVQP